MYKSLFIRGVMPILLVIALFMASAFLIIIPSFERSIMEQKREMIRELTNSAWNILAKFENDERAGLITRQNAQAAVIEQIRNLHYGAEMKDYFWINDMGPKMVIHPYRTDLNGTDLSGFSDPNGKKLFVEMASVVKKNGEGYVDYMWQHKDDETRIVPKISFVKGFAPWGWIIGTGVYLYDVMNEISSIKRGLVKVSLLIIAGSGLILLYLLSGQYRAEYASVKAAAALCESEEKYRTLVESAGEGIIMAVPGGSLFANQNMLQKLGYTLEDFSALSLDDIIITGGDELKDGGPYYKKHLAGLPAPKRYETALRTKDGASAPVMLSFSRIELQGREGLIAVASDVARTSRSELVREKLVSELQIAFLNLNMPAADICDKNPLKFYLSDKCGDIIAAMRESGRDSALILNEAGRQSAKVSGGPDGADNISAGAGQNSLIIPHIAGIISGADLFEPGFAALAAANRPVSEFGALKKPECIDSNTVFFEAFMQLESGGFRPLVVVSEGGGFTGVIEKNHLMTAHNYSPVKFLREISRASSPEEVITLSRRLAELAAIFVANGVKALHVNHFITRAADAVISRMIGFAIEKLGPPPAKFAFLVMGSEGRFEQTLKTDQDNAIVFEDSPAAGGADAAAVKNYFDEMGGMVCGWLAESGYSSCAGGVMAKNGRWCQPLSVWKNYFAGWIEKSEAEDLLKTKIFFDFRAAWGKKELADELRESLWGRLSANSRFFFLLARDVLRYEPPVGLFGNFVSTAGQNYEGAAAAGSKNSSGAVGAAGIDIKAVMTFIVDFARIYSLNSSVADTNSISRLAALCEKGVLKNSSYEEMSQAYSYLMHLRLENQVKKYRETGFADNNIDPYSLTSIDQKMLKEVFSQIKYFQVRLSYDFTGMSARI
jgi:PAS domain S-box-containing protein